MPDAILLDLNLPDSAGLQSVERVRAHAPRIPIVVFTGLADEQTGDVDAPDGHIYRVDR